MASDLTANYRSAGAADYEERRHGDPKWQFERDCVRRVLETYASRIDSVLDAPVGTGRFLELYEHLHEDTRVYGLDYSEDMLGVARARTASSRVVLQQQDIINQPIDIRADLVVCCRFLNLMSWQDAEKALRNLFAAARRLLVLAIRTVEDDYAGPELLDGKIHLHRRSSFVRMCQENGIEILRTEHFDTDRTGDYCMVTCAPRRTPRESRVNKNRKLVYTYGVTENEGKIYETKDECHVGFIRAVTNGSALRLYFPRVVDSTRNFIDAEWVKGDLAPADSWPQTIALLASIQSLSCSDESSFDYVEDLVIPRFRQALPLVGRELFDRVIAAIRDLSASFAPKVSHPDVIPGNVVISGERLVLIDNELLCRSRHYRVDILNVLNNLDPALRPRTFEAYLRLTGQTVSEWESQRDYLNTLWLARQVGSNIIMNQLERAQRDIARFQAGESILPYTRGGAGQ